MKKVPDNLLTHRGSWQKALARLVELEPNIDDREFWAHELHAMQDMYADVDRLSGAPAEGGGRGALVAMLREAVEYLHIHASNLAMDDYEDDAKDVRIFCDECTDAIAEIEREERLAND